jgi:four helix bundle protein
MRDFKKLRIWNDGFDLAKNIYQISGSLPSSEQFGLSSQTRRAAVSIDSNIAEGAGRQTEKEKSRFLDIALGSSYELETQLLLVYDLQFCTDYNLTSTIESIRKLQKAIYTLREKMKQVSK